MLCSCFGRRPGAKQQDVAAQQVRNEDAGSNSRVSSEVHGASALNDISLRPRDVSVQHQQRLRSSTPEAASSNCSQGTPTALVQELTAWQLQQMDPAARQALVPSLLCLMMVAGDEEAGIAGAAWRALTSQAEISVAMQTAVSSLAAALPTSQSSHQSGQDASPFKAVKLTDLPPSPFKFMTTSTQGRRWPTPSPPYILEAHQAQNTDRNCTSSLRHLLGSCPAACQALAQLLSAPDSKETVDVSVTSVSNSGASPESGSLRMSHVLTAQANGVLQRCIMLEMSCPSSGSSQRSSQNSSGSLQGWGKQAALAAAKSRAAAAPLPSEAGQQVGTARPINLSATKLTASAGSKVVTQQELLSRTLALLSNVPLSITLLDLQAGPIYQNDFSKSYWGVLDAPSLRAAATVAGAEGAAELLLVHLMQEETHLMQQMLTCVSKGLAWKRVVRVLPQGFPMAASAGPSECSTTDGKQPDLMQCSNTSGACTNPTLKPHPDQGNPEPASSSLANKHGVQCSKFSLLAPVAEAGPCNAPVSATTNVPQGLPSMQERGGITLAAVPAASAPLGSDFNQPSFAFWSIMDDRQQCSGTSAQPRQRIWANSSALENSAPKVSAPPPQVAPQDAGTCGQQRTAMCKPAERPQPSNRSIDAMLMVDWTNIDSTTLIRAAVPDSGQVSLELAALRLHLTVSSFPRSQEIDGLHQAQAHINAAGGYTGGIPTGFVNSRLSTDADIESQKSPRVTQPWARESPRVHLSEQMGAGPSHASVDGHGPRAPVELALSCKAAKLSTRTVSWKLLKGNSGDILLSSQPEIGCYSEGGSCSSVSSVRLAKVSKRGHSVTRSQGLLKSTLPAGQRDLFWVDPASTPVKPSPKLRSLMAAQSAMLSPALDSIDSSTSVLVKSFTSRGNSLAGMIEKANVRTRPNAGALESESSSRGLMTGLMQESPQRSAGAARRQSVGYGTCGPLSSLGLSSSSCSSHGHSTNAGSSLMNTVATSSSSGARGGSASACGAGAATTRSRARISNSQLLILDECYDTADLGDIAMASADAMGAVRSRDFERSPLMRYERVSHDCRGCAECDESAAGSEQVADGPRPVVAADARQASDERLLADAQTVQNDAKEQGEAEEQGEMWVVADAADVPATTWHEVEVIPFKDPVTGRDMLMLAQSDISARVEMEMRMASLTEAQVSMLDKLFPRHVLEFMAMTSGTRAPIGAPQKMPNLASLASQTDGCTILFTDIVGFTDMSKQVQPSQVMQYLNALFTLLDDLVDCYKVFKVEVAGDCYIVAGGLMTQDEDGFLALDRNPDVAREAEKVMAFAKALLRCAKTVNMPHNGQPTTVRVGIHTGPVVTGLIGSKLPKFSIFGDTMNTASRMESTCKPGCIHVSEGFHALLSGHTFTPTGGVDVKGKGRMQTFVWDPSEHPEEAYNSTQEQQQEAAALMQHISKHMAGKNSPIPGSNCLDPEALRRALDALEGSAGAATPGVARIPSPPPPGRGQQVIKLFTGEDMGHLFSGSSQFQSTQLQAPPPADASVPFERSGPSADDAVEAARRPASLTSGRGMVSPIAVRARPPSQGRGSPPLPPLPPPAQSVASTSSVAARSPLSGSCRGSESGNEASLTRGSAHNASARDAAAAIDAGRRRLSLEVLRNSALSRGQAVQAAGPVVSLAQSQTRAVEETAADAADREVAANQLAYLCNLLNNQVGEQGSEGAAGMHGTPTTSRQRHSCLPD